MNLNLCLEILNERRTGLCECNDLSSGHGSCIKPDLSKLQINQTASTALEEIVTVAESAELKDNRVNEMSNYELLKFMISLQRTRTAEYSVFGETLNHLICNNKLNEYPSLVCEMTSRFSVLSLNIIKIKVRSSSHNLMILY